MATAYKGASNDIQTKLRRVVEVWRQRNIFEQGIQEAVESRVDGTCSSPWIKDRAHHAIEIDKNRSTGKKPLLGGSLFSGPSGSSTPSELQPLVPLQVAVSKHTVASGASATTANAEYEKLNDPNTSLPPPPVYAARLSQLMKALANAESSVSEVIKSRTALIDGLEKLLETNRAALSKEQSLATQFSERKAETENKKGEVEYTIMRGLSAENPSGANLGDSGLGGEAVPRPEVEALTPPPVEALTPVGSPGQQQQEPALPGTSLDPQASAGFTLEGLAYPPAESSFPADLSTAFSDAQDPNGLHAKKRKVDHGEEDYSQFAGGELDADIAELLQQEGGAPKQ